MTMLLNFRYLSYAMVLSLTAITTTTLLLYVSTPDSISFPSTSDVVAHPSWPITFSQMLTPAAASDTNRFDFAGEFRAHDSAAPMIAPKYSSEPERHFPYPFVSGDMFRYISDFIYDEHEYKTGWHASDVGPCQTVFVKNDLLGEFFTNVFPLMQSPLILITHNGDDPSPGSYRNYLQDDRIYAWFGQNLDWTASEKMHAIPIGIANSQWSHGDLHVWRRVMAQDLPQWDQRSNLLFISWSDGTNPVRKQLKDQFQGFTNDTVVEDGNHDQFLQSLTRSKFVLSPPGNGIDCHRHWEAIMMGAVPIVQRSGLDSIFADGPAVVVDSFDQITEDWLRALTPSSSYNRNVIWANYWLNKIKNSVETCREQNA